MSTPVSPFFNRYVKAGVVDGTGKMVTPTPIENDVFVGSMAGRAARVVAEFTEFPHRLDGSGVRGTFLFFGSARAMSPADFAANRARLVATAADASKPAAERAAAEKRLADVSRQEWMCRWYDVTFELAELLTAWARSDEGRRVGALVSTHFPRNEPHPEQPLIVCTGGGPGFMEAANKGAAAVPGGISMGVSVTLPFEKNLNPFVTPGLNFRTEYFFSRKFWEVFAAKAMICAPGGMGTCDEMFEVMTLMQCHHSPPMPVVLLGAQFWRDIINFDRMAEYGVISKAEVDSLCFADDAQTAFEFIRRALVAEADANAAKAEAAAAAPSTPTTK